MHLKLIKLVGFKSFVGPTTVPLPSPLCGIIGPNGCGKSNIVDAIRWVIGESSAKQLRGQSMSDVIFNGSHQRKPVGKASVELIFDNSSNRLGGEFTKFSEISVRREVYQEGQSQYFLNGTHCRRRDITDVFLGTGLGSRNYAIIEQGMISQFIEAKPDELRAHLEEAAGISKYKERRRETEIRLQHTKENLDRLQDVLAELDKQLRHLKRQASAAERYKELTQQERILQAQIKVLHWREFAVVATEQAEHIERQQTQISAYTEQWQQLEAQQLLYSEQQQAAQRHRDETQQHCYELKAEINHYEQQIAQQHQQIKTWEGEFNRNQHLEQELQHQLIQYKEQQRTLTTQIEETQPQLEAAKRDYQQAAQILANAESEMQTWQQGWNELQRTASQAKQQLAVTEAKQQHHQKQLQNLHQRHHNLQQRLEQLNIASVEAELLPLKTAVNESQKQLTILQQQSTKIREELSRQRTINQQHKQQLNHYQRALQQHQQRHATLSGLQQAALGQQNNTLKEWLNRNHWQQYSRLGQQLTVSSGWELAVETVLQSCFEAVCLEDETEIVATLKALQDFSNGSIMLVSGINKHTKNAFKTSSTTSPKQQGDTETVPITGNAKKITLANYVNSAWPIDDWLAGIYVTDNITDALEIYQQLQTGESVITRDGIWLGQHWVRVNKIQGPQSGILVREQQLRHLQQEMAALIQQCQEEQRLLTEGEQQCLTLETEQEQNHRQYQKISQSFTQAQSTLSATESRLQALQQQQQRSLQELQECNEQLATEKAQLQTLEQKRIVVEIDCKQLTEQQQQYATQQAEHQQQLAQTRLYAQQFCQHADQLSVRLTTHKNELKLIKQTCERDQRQFDQLLQRQQVLAENLTQSQEPLIILQQKLQIQRETHAQLEQTLLHAQQEVGDYQKRCTAIRQQHQKLSHDLEYLKQQLQQLQIHHQEIHIRQQTILEQLEAMQMDLQQLLSTLPDKIHLEHLEQQLEQTAARIARLGAINLAAITEYQTIHDRKTYLDQQQTDLLETLDVLNKAMSKIDRETKARFREIFEQANQNFQQLFPKIFGGGAAELLLAEDDLLSTGVIVKAQPPGKRNASVHLLSGGEKALTAISLVFAFFQINPAPFCILDEVDAPLDDANVGRFCQLVKEMSAQTQFIVVSHNKTTISSVQHLMGVTMQEAGVSRIVGVDIQQALAIVES